jgi:hypothetical protein
VAHGLHHHRVGGADQGAPRLFFPELKVFGGNEFVADDAPGHRAEPGLVAGVDHLLRGGRIEVGDRLGAENEDAVAAGRDGKSPSDFAVYLDCVVGTCGEALPAADAAFVFDFDQHRLIHRHRDGVGGADADTSQARDTELGINDEIQRPDPPGGKFAI